MEPEPIQEAGETPELADDYENEAAEVRPNLTVEEAAEIHRDNVRGHEPEPERPEPPKAQPEPEDSDPGALWSTQDVAAFQTLRAEAEAYQKDAADLEKIKKSVNLNELEKTDRARAAMFRSMIREAEDDLRQRRGVIEGAARHYHGRAEEHVTKQAWKKAEAEKAKLLKARPDFDHVKCVEYLKANGATDAELASITDHRVLIMAWDAAKAAAGPKVPKFKKRRTAAGQKAPGDLIEAEERFRQTGREDDAASLLALRRKHKAPPSRQTQPPSADDLHDRLKQTGRIEDAVAYKLAKKGRAA